MRWQIVLEYVGLNPLGRSNTFKSRQEHGGSVGGRELGQGAAKGGVSVVSDNLSPDAVCL